MDDDEEEPEAESYSFVRSSFVLSAKWLPDSEELRVTFRDGARFAYTPISEQEWIDFRRAVSPGAYVREVLNAKYFHQI
jgi:hypothetical protein